MYILQIKIYLIKNSKIISQSYIIAPCMMVCFLITAAEYTEKVQILYIFPLDPR
jgi:hypothetical protein